MPASGIGTVLALDHVPKTGRRGASPYCNVAKRAKFGIGNGYQCALTIGFQSLNWIFQLIHRCNCHRLHVKNLRRQWGHKSFKSGETGWDWFAHLTLVMVSLRRRLHVIRLKLLFNLYSCSAITWNAGASRQPCRLSSPLSTLEQNRWWCRKLEKWRKTFE